MTDLLSHLRVALTQWHATSRLADNLAVATAMIQEAGEQGAKLVLLPENGLMIGTTTAMCAAALEIDSPEITALRDVARRSDTAVILGGFKHRAADGKIYNTALVIDAKGEIAGMYDKIHMFDASVGGQTFSASRMETAGASPVLLSFGGVKIGVTICYDVRFPELYRRLALAGAQIFVVPAAFTHTTGKAHWEVLLRARAIENACFVLASATVRGELGSDAFETYGHALAVGPWGEIIADLGDAKRSCRVVELQVNRVAEVRKSLPVLRGVKPDVYAAPIKTISLADGAVA